MATSNWLNTNTTNLYYIIEVIENSINETSLLSSVTVRVKAFNTGTTSYAFHGRTLCRINDTLYHNDTASSKSIGGDYVTLFEKTLNIPHDDDGYKELSVTAWIVATYSMIKSDEQGFSVDLTPIHVPSQPSCITYPNTTQNIGEFGDEIVIYMNNKRPSEYKHTVRIEFGSTEITPFSVAAGNGIVHSTKWIIPPNFMNEIPNATSGVGTIYVDTYSGSTLVGTRSVTFTASVPASVVPIVDSITFADSAGLFERFGKYVQGQSDLDVDIVVSGAYGADIKSCNTVIDGKTYTTESFSIENINSSGDIAVTTTVTDTRGRKTIVTNSISIYPYSVPQIKALKVSRCNSDGTPNSTGAYLKAVFSVVVTSLDEKNSVAYTIQRKKRTEANYTTVDLTEHTNTYSLTDAVYIFEADTNASYDVILSVDDDVDPKTKGVVGSSISVLWSKLAKGLGFAIGKVAELAGVFDIAFKTRFEGGILQPVIPYGTDFDTLLIPNTYSGLNAGSANYLNCPIDDDTFTLEVLGAGDEDVIHRVTSCSKTAPEIYERHYSGGSWDEWVLKSADYIIEQGIKNNWVYEKYKSGITKMWIGTSVPVLNGATETVKAIEYPFTFKNYPVAFAQGVSNSWRFTKPVMLGVGLQRIAVTVYTDAGTEDGNIGVNIMVISQAE